MYPFISAVLALAIVIPSLGGQNLSDQDRTANAIALARQGKFVEAERELRLAVSAAPAVGLYRAQLGSVLGLQGKWKAALESFQKAVQLSPGNLDFRRETAAVQWQMGLLSGAETNLQYVLGKHPQDPGAILLLGLVKEKKGDYPKAAHLLDSQFDLVSSQPERTVALFHSVVESKQGDKMPKLLEALKFHAKDPSWAAALTRCTQLALKAEDLQTAATLFPLISASDPDRPATSVGLARLLYNSGQVSQAKELLLQLKSQGVENADLEMLLGNCFESERQPEQAIAAYRRAIDAEPSQIARYEDLVSLLLYLHRTADAEAFVKQALTLAPNDSRPWVWKGNADLRRNDYKGAMESYQHAVHLDRKNPDALFGVAAAFYVTGQNDAAMSECKMGISRFPNDSRFYVSYAEMLVASPDAMQRQAEAKDLLSKALKLAPESAQAHYLLGQIALQQGQLEEAEKYFLHSLAFDPDRSKTHFALSRVYRRMGRPEQAAKEIALYQHLKGAEDTGNTTPLAMPENQ